jgi:hypothetical protein
MPSLYQATILSDLLYGYETILCPKGRIKIAGI